LQEKKEYLFDFGTCEGDIFQLFSCKNKRQTF
jgi:hypothetical protein